jgi:hypothetical protein
MLAIDNIFELLQGNCFGHLFHKFNGIQKSHQVEEK